MIMERAGKQTDSNVSMQDAVDLIKRTSCPYHKFHFTTRFPDGKSEDGTVEAEIFPSQWLPIISQMTKEGPNLEILVYPGVGEWRY